MDENSINLQNIQSNQSPKSPLLDPSRVQDDPITYKDSVNKNEVLGIPLGVTSLPRQQSMENQNIQPNTQLPPRDPSSVQVNPNTLSNSINKNEASKQPTVPVANQQYVQQQNLQQTVPVANQQFIQQGNFQPPVQYQLVEVVPVQQQMVQQPQNNLISASKNQQKEGSAVAEETALVVSIIQCVLLFFQGIGAIFLVIMFIVRMSSFLSYSDVDEGQYDDSTVQDEMNVATTVSCIGLLVMAGLAVILLILSVILGSTSAIMGFAKTCMKNNMCPSISYTVTIICSFLFLVIGGVFSIVFYSVYPSETFGEMMTMAMAIGIVEMVFSLVYCIPCLITGIILSILTTRVCVKHVKEKNKINDQQVIGV